MRDAVMERYGTALSHAETGPHADADAELEYSDEQLGIAALELAQAWQASQNKPVGWPADGLPHAYLSTSCLHEEHDYCKAPEGSNGETTWAKTPARCKFCGAACVCGCHHGEEPEPAHSKRESRNENPVPPVRLANVEVKGFRDLGVVAVSEITLAGVPFLHAESRDGSAADFPASSVHFIAWLPPGSPWPEKPKAIASRPSSFGYDDAADGAWNPTVHANSCNNPDCNGDCVPF